MMPCFLWGIGILGGLFIIGYLVSCFDESKEKARRAHLNSDNATPDELRKSARKFLTPLKVEETTGVVSQRTRTCHANLDDLLPIYDMSMDTTLNNHYLACVTCEYYFYLLAFSSFNSLGKIDRGIINSFTNEVAGKIFYARSRLLYKLFTLQAASIGKGIEIADSDLRKYIHLVGDEKFCILSLALSEYLPQIKTMGFCSYEQSEELFTQGTEEFDEFWKEEQLWTL